MSKSFSLVLGGFVFSVVLSLAGTDSAIAHAVSTQFDLDGDGKNETTATSTRVQAGDLQNDFYDTISVANAHAFTGLTFDWELPGAQRFKGGLPVGAKWSDTNHYDSYITPFVFNYSINLTPTGCPVGVGCPAVTKTAEAWSPVNLYNSLKAIRDLFSVGDSGTVEGDIDLGTSSPKVELSATMTAEGGNLTLFQYYAKNLTDSSVRLDWQFYTQNIDSPFRSLDATVAPGGTALLDSVLSNGDPYETAGEVYATIGGDQISFIAPSLSPLPEPSAIGLFGASLIALGLMHRRRGHAESARSVKHSNGSIGRPTRLHWRRLCGLSSERKELSSARRGLIDEANP